MELQSADCLNAIEGLWHLPEGATLVFQRFSWEDYENLMAALEHRNLRAAYDRGRLEIMSPLAEHGDYASFLEAIVRIVADALNLEVQGYGNATWKKASLARGAEGDACFYVTNANRVIGKHDLDLEIDPPPDIVAEIDITNESLSKFPIYAALAVPEIWRFDGATMEFWNLEDDAYREVGVSRFLPNLTPAPVAAVFRQGRSEGQTKALRAFRKAFTV